MKILVIIVPIIISILLAFLFLNYKIDNGICPFSEQSCFYHENYYGYRSQFRQLSYEIKANQFQFKVDSKLNKSDDLTIDISIISNQENKSNNKPLLVHICGTHGIEFFAGCAIQLAYLDQIKYNKNKYDDVNIVFVHSINPFGSLYQRRMNENGVDLNRNMLQENEFQELKKSGGAKSKQYKSLNETLNPAKFWNFGFDDFYYYLFGIKNLITIGFDEMNEIFVTGQYFYQKGLFFGGFELQRSNQVLLSFLQQHFPNPSKVIILDMHTGLGPTGKDTLMVQGEESYKKTQNLFLGTNFNEGKDFFIDSGCSTAVGKGYQNVKGQLQNIVNFMNWQNNSLFIAQEFGTVHGIFVSKALVEENQNWHYGNKIQKAISSQSIKNAFFVNSKFFKENLIKRGLSLIQQSLQTLNSTSNL